MARGGLLGWSGELWVECEVVSPDGTPLQVDTGQSRDPSLLLFSHSSNQNHTLGLCWENLRSW